MYKPQYFEPHELVPQHIYEKYGSLSLQFMDDRILMVADALRKRYGPVTLNNYYWGGNRQWQGLRTNLSPDYSPTSQHSFGRAIDARFKNHTAEEVRDDLRDFGIGILKLPNHISTLTIEDDVSWLHVDCRNRGHGLRFFKP